MTEELIELIQNLPTTQLTAAKACLKGLSSSKRFVFAVDLDGVVADFYEGLRPVAAEWLGVAVDTLTEDVSYGLPEWNVTQAPGGYEALHRFAVTQRDLFKTLKPIHGAAQALRALSESEIRIRIVTHRLYIKRFHRSAIEQTVDWLDRHDVPYWDLCFMKDKAAVGADLYIDDSPTNIEALLAEKCDTIVFSNSTNRDKSFNAATRADDWTAVKEIVLRKKQVWSSRP